MSKNKILAMIPFYELICNNAREADIPPTAIEVELKAMLRQDTECFFVDERHAVVRNSYLPQRSIQINIGDLKIKLHKIRGIINRIGNGISFNSSFLAPYLNREKTSKSC
ncbi:MAG: hypothetical protein ACTS73_04435 [Arsenophonus sp. NEOnobi-MAG3]